MSMKTINNRISKIKVINKKAYDKVKLNLGRHVMHEKRI